VTNGVATKYYLFGAQRVALKKGGILSYLHNDHLSGTNTVTNASGGCTGQQAYYPYGSIRTIAPNPPCTTSMPTDVGFTGQRLDASSGLMFYNARYYDPTLGRFITADTIVPNPGNPQDLNRYSYTRNNPVRYIDPTGRFCVPCILVVGAALVYVGMLPGDTGPYPPDPAGDFVAEFPLRVVSDPADYILTGRDCLQANCDAIDIALAAAPILSSQMRKAADFTYTTRAIGEADEFIQGVAKTAEDTIVEKNLLGSFDVAKLEANQKKEILSGVFMYKPSKEFHIDGYQQHHLWPQGLGGPKQGCVLPDSKWDKMARN
jgi:RHS repeat-associated protein